MIVLDGLPTKIKQSNQVLADVGIVKMTKMEMTM